MGFYLFQKIVETVWKLRFSYMFSNKEICFTNFKNEKFTKYYII